MPEEPPSQRKRDLLRFAALGIAVLASVLALDAFFALSDLRGVPALWLRRSTWVIPWAAGLAVFIHSLRKRRWVPIMAFLGAHVLGLYILISMVFLGPVVWDHATRVPFQAERWRAENHRGGEGLRIRMVDDLLRRHRLVGMRRTEIDALLGVPPRSDYFREYDYVYWLGQERGAFAIDSEWLVVEFEGDVVSKVEVVTD